MDLDTNRTGVKYDWRRPCSCATYSSHSHYYITNIIRFMSLTKLKLKLYEKQVLANSITCSYFSKQ